MVIRKDTTKDHAEVYQLIKEAFETAEHTDGSEQDLVCALRKSDAFIADLSLVAEISGEIAGHILFTKARVGNAEVVALAPLSVKPVYQRQGVGTALIKEGHRIAKELGYQYSLVLGSELYYPRMGYRPASQLGAELPLGIPDQNFMIAKLRNDAKPIRGPVAYAKEFGL